MNRIIFHVDVNNAFLSWTAVYLLKNNYGVDIRKIASVIGGDEEKRHGIVLAKSPVAKQYNINTAETLYSARKKCPNLKVFPPMMDLYHEQSKKLYDYLSQYTPIIEQFSIDECFLDLSNTKYLYDDIIALAYKIKDEIKEMYGFTVNVGVANNKLCAKMASDFTKPDKVHTLFSEEIKTKMWPLDVSDLLYIGKSSTEILHRIGIKTIGDLANCEENFLKPYFKNRAIEIINSAKGIDDSNVIEYVAKNKCLSISTTLIKDTNNEHELKNVLLDLSNQLAIRLRKEKLYANVAAITYKDSNLRGYSKQKKISNNTNNTMEIYNAILSIYNEIDKNILIRNIGIRLSDLTNNSNKQISLFDSNHEYSSNNIQNIIDEINIKYKNTKIMPAIFYKKE